MLNLRCVAPLSQAVQVPVVLRFEFDEVFMLQVVGHSTQSATVYVATGETYDVRPRERQYTT